MIKNTKLLDLLTAFGFDITDVVIKSHRVFPFADVWYLDTLAPLRKFEAVADDLAYKLGVKALYVKTDIKRKLIKLIAVSDKVKYVKQSVESEGTAIPLGMGIEGPLYHDFKSHPHLLVAGTTGSGKSCFVQTILLNILKAKLPYFSIVPMDFKRTELTSYEKFLPPIIKPVVDIETAKNALEDLVTIMNTRYTKHLKDVYRDIDEFNAADNPTKLDRIFVVIDEFADMMMSGNKKDVKAIENYIIRLAQKSRAAGIHLILATQRPTVNVISGLIKANIEARVAFKVSTGVESNIILDESGAEKLGSGSLLYKVGEAVLGKVFEMDFLEKQLLLQKTVVNTDAKASNYTQDAREKSSDLEIEWASEELASGLSTLAVVSNKVRSRRVWNAQDLLVTMANEEGLAIDDIHFAVQCSLSVLENEGVVKNVRPIGTYRTDAGYDTFASWTIVNLEWEEPDKHDKDLNEQGFIKYGTGELTESGKTEVTTVLKNATMDQRVKVLQRLLGKL